MKCIRTKSLLVCRSIVHRRPHPVNSSSMPLIICPVPSLTPISGVVLLLATLATTCLEPKKRFRYIIGEKKMGQECGADYCAGLSVSTRSSFHNQPDCRRPCFFFFFLYNNILFSRSINRIGLRCCSASWNIEINSWQGIFFLNSFIGMIIWSLIVDVCSRSIRPKRIFERRFIRLTSFETKLVLNTVDP